MTIEVKEHDPMSIRPQTSSPTKTGTLWRGLMKDKYLYLLAIPGLVYFLIFKYVPLFWLLISFQDYSPYLGMFKSPWVGFEHFERFIVHADFFMIMRNTLAINLLNILFFFPLPIILSLMLNEVRNSSLKRIVQTVIYLPHFLSWVIVIGISFLVFSQSQGIFNLMLDYLGFKKFDFFTNPNIFWFVLVGQSIWKDVGWGTIIFLAAITAADPQLYESARMDGAGRFRQMWHITLPAIRMVIVILLILRIGEIMDVGFEHVFLMMNGAVSEVADVFDTYVYRLGIGQGQFSFSTAVGLFKSVVGLILVIGANRLSRKLGQDGVY
jgi:putative aldouronate transport system permease protein